MPSPQTDRARYLRHNMTGVEWRLWRHLRARQLGVKFRRQHPIGPYIVDFACLSAQLVVEVDRDAHEDAYDVHRDRWMESRGWRVMRFSLQDIDESLDSVVAAIYLELGLPDSDTHELPRTDADLPSPPGVASRRRPPRTAGRES
jgi:very-short-patch-repair endonuclease